ncbi:MAG: hypothetical protein KBT68_06200, partial [bacterium]|nr:hypothetical protein [Candidatus Colisoma equi]
SSEDEPDLHESTEALSRLKRKIHPFIMRRVKKTVYVMKMIASNTIEEKVLALQRRKQAIIAATVDTTDAAVMESLTADDLRDLLS